MIRSGYAGTIVPINPNRSEVMGFPSYESIRASGVDVDLALIVVAQDRVEGALRDCVDSGVRLVSIMTAGFGELGTAEGDAQQDRLRAITAGTDTRVLGPNCLGLMDPSIGMFATGTAAVEAAWPEPGGVAVISQSGAVGSTILTELHGFGLGIRMWVSTGNESDVTCAELVDHLADDQQTDTILMYVESIRDAAAMRSAIRRAVARGKRLFVLKAGIGDLARRAVTSHTGALATADRYYDVLFEESGAVRVRSIRELVDCSRLAAEVPSGAGQGLAIFTLSGGLGALAADELEVAGLRPAAIRAETQERLRELVPTCAPANPIDATGQASSDFAILRAFLDAILGEDDVDILFLILGHLGSTPSYAEQLFPLLKDVSASTSVPIVAITHLPEHHMGRLGDTGIPVFTDVGDAMRTISLVSGRVQDRRRSKTSFSPGRTSGGEITESGLKGARTVRVWPEHEALLKLSEAGIPAVSAVEVSGVDSLEAAAAHIGFPLALKAVLTGVSHKSELGAVRLGISDMAAALEAYDQLTPLIAEYGGVCVAEPMIENAIAELIIGGVVDDTFGPHVIVGSGGIWAEIADDSQIASAPIDEAQARVMIEGLRIAPILQGARSRPAADLESAAKAVVAMGKFVADTSLGVTEVEVNPFIISERGGLAVDALIMSQVEE